MIRILLDTNVVLDALLDRAPFDADAKFIWQAHWNDELSAHISAATLTDIFYVARRHVGGEAAWAAVRACLDQLYVIGVGANEIHSAASLPGSDFEDNLQIACSAAVGLDAIVTRDQTGFGHSPVTVITPRELIQRLATHS